jgi:hypothetical protein
MRTIRVLVKRFKRLIAQYRSALEYGGASERDKSVRIGDLKRRFLDAKSVMVGAVCLMASAIGGECK